MHHLFRKCVALHDDNFNLVSKSLVYKNLYLFFFLGTEVVLGNSETWLNAQYLLWLKEKLTLEISDLPIQYRLRIPLIYSLCWSLERGIYKLVLITGEIQHPLTNSAFIIAMYPCLLRPQTLGAGHRLVNRWRTLGVGLQGWTDIYLGS